MNVGKDLVAASATPLADGAISCVLSSFAWASFDPVRFLWTDIEREHDLAMRQLVRRRLCRKQRFRRRV